LDADRAALVEIRDARGCDGEVVEVLEDLLAPERVTLAPTAKARVWVPSTSERTDPPARWFGASTGACAAARAWPSTISSNTPALWLYALTSA
jgi:hypothetical protein